MLVSLKLVSFELVSFEPPSSKHASSESSSSELSVDPSAAANFSHLLNLLTKNTPLKIPGPIDR